MRRLNTGAVLETGRRLCFQAVVLGSLILYKARAAGIWTITTLVITTVAVGAVEAPDEPQRPPLTHTKPPCTPPGTPEDLWLWPIELAWMAEVKVAGGGQAPVPIVIYAKDGQKVRISWVGAQPAVIDLQPDNKDAPAWVNRGVLDDRGRIRLHQSVLCRWEQVGGQQA